MTLKNPGNPALAGIKAALFALLLIPAALMAQGWFADTLGANPVESIRRSTGEWTLNLLLMTLAVTPLRRLTGLHWLLRLRRMLGLFTFAYACLHLASYVWLDQWFDWGAIAEDILERPFITVGFAAFVLMLPLAATSSNLAIRHLGGRRWQALHRSIYAIAIFSVLHYWWLVKADVSMPLAYTLVLAALLGVRGWWRELERRRQLATAPAHLPQFKGKVIRIIPK